MAAGVSLEVRLQDLQLMQGAMKGVIALGHNPQPMLADIGRYGEESTKLRFRDQVGPDGQRWKPSRRALADGGLTLVKSTNLMQSVTSFATRTEATWGTNLIYAPIHQSGGTIEPRSAKALAFNIPGVGLVFAHKVTMPARPFVGINASDQANIADIIIDHYDQAVGG